MTKLEEVLHLDWTLYNVSVGSAWAFSDRLWYLVNAVKAILLPNLLFISNILFKIISLAILIFTLKPRILFFNIVFSSVKLAGGFSATPVASQELLYD